MLHPCANTVHKREGGESDGVSKEDIGRPDLPLFLGSDVSSAPWLLGGSEGHRALLVVQLFLSVRYILRYFYPSCNGPSFAWWGSTKSRYPSLVEIGYPESSGTP